MNDIYIAPLQGIYPWTYVVILNGRPYRYLTVRPGFAKLTWSEEQDIIAGMREWFDHEDETRL